MKAFVLTIAVFVSSTAFAGLHEIQIHVKGMVCGFCAQGLKKKFSSNEAVETLSISLEKRLVRLFVKDQPAITDEDIRRTVEKAGFKVESIERLGS